MPRDLGTIADAVGTDGAIDLTEFTARLDEAGADLSQEDGLTTARTLLARLAANPDFLAERAIAELKAGCAEQARINGYGAQVLMLHRVQGRHFVRANFWPAADDPVVQASGQNHYFYHVPHDHNFDFLTVGYSGPGYRSRWFEIDPYAIAGYPGEPLTLCLIEDGQLSPGRLLHYRAHRDVHDQLPPTALSISLNIVPESPTVMWRDQYLIDADHRTIASVPTISQAEILLRIAVACGDGNGMDVAQEFAARHPSHRVRWSAWSAIIGAAAGRDERVAMLDSAVADASPLVSGNARATLALVDQGTSIC